MNDPDMERDELNAMQGEFSIAVDAIKFLMLALIVRIRVARDIANEQQREQLEPMLKQARELKEQIQSIPVVNVSVGYTSDY